MLLCLDDDRKRIEIPISCKMHQVGKQVDEVTRGTSMGAAQLGVCFNGGLGALQRRDQIAHRDRPGQLLDNAQIIASRPACRSLRDCGQKAIAWTSAWSILPSHAALSSAESTGSGCRQPTP